MVDTRRDEASARTLKAFWSNVGRERMRDGATGRWAYTVCAVSEEQLARLEALQQAMFKQMRAIIAEPEPATAVALLNLQIVRLDEPDA